MQKNVNFRKIYKLYTILSIFVVLLLSVLAAEFFIVRYSSSSSCNLTSAHGTIYTSLSGIVTGEASTNDNSKKMNNSLYKNANINYSFAKKADYSKIEVYEHISGKSVTEDIEYYTLCVLIAEMPQSYDSQALMAQAIACRTYAVRNKYCGGKHEGADVCTDYRCCQSYKDAKSVTYDISKAKEAVQATRGIVAVYGGEPILAAYHASSYISTKSGKDAWGGNAEYLAAVSAPESKDDCSYSTSIAKEKCESLFEKQGYSGKISFILSDNLLCAGADIGGKKLTSKDIQSILLLRSDAFDISESDGAYTFTCYGYGHGVGMSQHGADILAKRGYSFYDILKYYYTGISFEFIS